MPCLFSAFSFMASYARAPAQTSSVEELKKLQRQSFDIVSGGLDIDEVDPIQAMGLYKRGITIMRQAVRMNFGPNETEARLIQDKMQQNMEQIEDRCRTIEERVASRKPIGTVNALSFPVTHGRPSSQIIAPPTYVAGAIPSKYEKSMENLKSIPQSVVQATNASTELKKKAAFEKLKTMDPKIRDIILNEVVMDNPGIGWDHISGLESAKQALQEAAVLPLLRPDIFRGLRSPARGVLLFGPPGNGKTFLARCMASECDAVFFGISASSLTSKWVGDSEKLVRCLFTAARNLQPAIVFIDEIDSILGERSTQENESSRRLKTEFLVQFDGVNTSDSDQVVVIGATNRPQDLDEAVRRRLVKRIYVPLPDTEARLSIIKNLLSKESNIDIKADQMKQLARRTNGYSGSDLAALCKNAALEPVRELGASIKNMPLDQLRPINYEDFNHAIKKSKPSVSAESVEAFEEWEKQFGSTKKDKKLVAYARNRTAVVGATIQSTTPILRKLVRSRLRHL
ncbi:spastin-like [Planoprotostelium fungivorum]|uniref:microtubule-severing ATPase n=1 Tax=Planoprotostelium fungivorum TaxID=1890364 RepID=A0A2P6N7Z2_9EUKA|nr:spastin-like [Planoprotostelium fungivorum]